jgi:hypothetical protein
MRSRTNRVRRSTPTRRNWPAQSRRQAGVRRQPTRRYQPTRRRDYGGRRPYSRESRFHALHLGRNLHSAIAAGAALTIAVVGAAFLMGGFKHAPVAVNDPVVADQIVYTARTANDAAVTLPSRVQGDLSQAARAACPRPRST